MIRYAVTFDDVPVTLEFVKDKITALKPTWFARTKAVTDALSDEPKSADFTGLWSEIKDIYIELQHSKCVFCEQPLEGRITQDVEHFRPKAAVAHWEPPQDLIDAGIVVAQPDDGSAELGYRFLAYHPFNYAAACKVCNLDAIDNRNDAAIVNAAKTNVTRMLRDTEPFANCLRCFHRLYQQSPAEAKQKFLDASVFLDTVSP